MFRQSSLLVALLVAAACKGRDASPGTKVEVPPTPPAGVYTLDDFRHLRWIDGRWQGFRADGFKFYEEYKFLDDSTIAMRSYPDPTYAQAGDSSRIVLRKGRVTNDAGDARWFATRLDSIGIDFAPEKGAMNFFTWAKEAPTQWSATLRWTENGRPMSVTYAMHRFGR